MSTKRKLDSSDDVPLDISVSDLAEYCRQSVMPRIAPAAVRADGDELASFYPLPPELNDSVLSSLRHHLGDRGMDAVQHVPGIIQPFGSSAVPELIRTESGASSMDEDCASASVAHGPQCQSIPQLSVKHYGGTASQLWALCPDCGTYSKVQEDQPVKLCYSP